MFEFNIIVLKFNRGAIAFIYLCDCNNTHPIDQ